ncbi:MAG TPA: hypothetical protein PKG77_11105 [Phycisphaerae bacterium]|nr:hypothetical protein [Phycisphaerae bacterium]HQL75873.1 hypothetical protein [Phycisphaerae bacterium]
MLNATPKELTLIEEMTSRGAFDRLDAGGGRIVSEDGWSDIPELPVDVEARFRPNTTRET